jgi:hypothetical protein
MLSIITPQVRLKKESNVRPVTRTAVGNRGTNPVSMNVAIMGHDIITEITSNNIAIAPKKNSGLVSSRSFITLRRI